MIPKKDYMTLSKAGKAKVRRQAVKEGQLAPKKKAKGIKRRAPRIKGKGDYSLVDYEERPFQTYGSKIGGYLGKQIGNVFGSGDYKIKGNSLLINPGSEPAQFSGKRSTRIRHREYIQDILSSGTLTGSSTNFQIQGFAINPGLGETFPWLNAVAENYETYKIHGMLFEFRPMSYDAISSTNTASGTVILATQYNANSPGFVTKQQMENYEFAQSVKPSQCVYHYIECEPYETPVTELYIRTGIVGTQDLRLYDWGQFFIATQGMQAANVNLGELWVTYDIEVFKPKMTGGDLGASIDYYHGTFSSSVSTSNYFAGNLPSSYSSFLPVFGTNTITLPSFLVQGSYFLIYSVYGNSTAWTAPGIVGTTNCVVTKLWDLTGGNYSLYTPTNSSNTGTQLCTVIFFTVNNNSPGANAVITFSSGTMPSSVTGGDIIITQTNGFAN